MRDKLELSVVIPMHNEEATVDQFFCRLVFVLNSVAESYEVICVNDGSTDDTLLKLLEYSKLSTNFRIIDLSRNFGKEAALSAGLAHALGEAAILIDADLQDPPEVITAFYAKWKEGYDVVSGVRKTRPHDTAAKRLSASAFYRIYNSISSIKLIADAGDFRLLSRRAINAINLLPERRRFMKGIYSWIGFRQTEIEYERCPRAGGASNWTYWKLWNFALDGLSSFTTLPLRLWTYLGFGVMLFSVALFLMFFVLYILSSRNPPGFYWIISLILFFGSIQLVSIGVLGEYLGRTLEECKARPLYLIKNKIGFEDGDEMLGLEGGHENVTTPRRFGEARRVPLDPDAVC